MCGVPAVLAMIAGNWNYWPYFRVLAVFFGYLWIYLLSVLASSTTNGAISQFSVNYGGLVLAPSQLYAFNNNPWTGDFTSARLVVSMGLAFVILTAFQVMHHIRVFTRQVVDDTTGAQVGVEEEIKPFVEKPKTVRSRREALRVG